MHRRHLPISSCTADWNAMLGTHAVRFCEGCRKRVYNLSALSEPAARAALAVRPREACVRASGEVVFAAVVALTALSACSHEPPPRTAAAVRVEATQSQAPDPVDEPLQSLDEAPSCGPWQQAFEQPPVAEPEPIEDGRLMGMLELAE